MFERAGDVAAFGEEMKLVAPLRDRFTNELFAVGVTFGGVDYVDAGIERGAKNFCRRFRAGALVADFRAAESEHTDLETGFSEDALFHRLSIKQTARRFETPQDRGRKKQGAKQYGFAPCG